MLYYYNILRTGLVSGLYMAHIVLSGSQASVSMLPVLSTTRTGGEAQEDTKYTEWVELSVTLVFNT